MTARLIAVLSALCLLAACGKPPEQPAQGPQTINFAILSAENQQSMSQYWQPLLDDLTKQTGLTVKPFYTTNYASQIEAMRFGKVQVGWFSALPALEAVRRADGQVLGRVVDSGGANSYESVLIVRKDSGLTLDKVMACDKRLTFGIGDAKSTSGTLAPMTYLFIPKGVEPVECFKTVRAANHQSNLFSVANGVLDVATGNSVGLAFAARENPRLAGRLRVIWRSPPLPESSIVVRKDLDPAVTEKLRQFFITYGTTPGAEGDKQREVLKGLMYGGFRAADESYLDPIREMEAAQALADAKRSGDADKVATAQKAFDDIRAKAAERRAADPDI